MPQNAIQDLPAGASSTGASSKSATRKRQRLIGWLGLGLMLSLVPLLVTGAMDYEPGKRSFLQVLSTEELLTVAFTLSGAAAVDILIDSRENVWKFALGVVTLLMTLVTMVGYVLFKGHLTHLTQDTIVGLVQSLYVATAILAFLCELLSEA